jgi:hypothetical protein
MELTHIAPAALPVKESFPGIFKASKHSTPHTRRPRTGDLRARGLLCMLKELDNRS